MKTITSIFFFWGSLLSFGQIIAQSTPAPVFPTSLVVAQDGSGNYKTIQEAINAVRDLSQKQVKIFIKKGVYREKVNVPSWKTNISLIGEDKDSTIVTNNDYTNKQFPGKDPGGRNVFITYTSYTLLVQGNDFTAEGLTIENTAGRVGQAVALHIEGDRCLITNCRLLGNQDTLYAATANSRQYYQNCYIEGTTDFIFGEATVVFTQCVIKSLTNSYITAAATREGQQFGFVFFDCRFIADTAAKKVYLGRPWRPHAQTVFIRCELGSHILAQGWDPWKGDAMFPDKEKTTFYAEYGNTGPGAANAERVYWSKQLTEEELKKYTIKNILGGKDNWLPAIR
jgi:pectinesterase